MPARDHRPRQPMHYPIALEQQFRKTLQPVVEACHRAMVQVILPALPSRLPVGMDAVNVRLKATKLDDLGRAGHSMVTKAFNERLMKQALAMQAGKLDDFQLRQLRARLVKAMGLKRLGGLLAARETKKLIEDFVETNVGLIKTIPESYFTSIQGKIKKSAEQGIRVESLSKDLQSTYGVASSRADFIARDQVGKLYGQLNETRQKSVGIKTYIWRTTGDERVREYHRQLEGEVCDWNDPPETNEDGDTNHPGEDYQCRCTAEPNLDELKFD